jgi:hypothetical protein
MMMIDDGRRDRIMRGRSVRTLLVAAIVVFGCVSAALAHGVASADYEASITSTKPKGLPIDVSVVNRDQLRVENVGSKELMLCGYGTADDDGCEQYVRLGPKGVDVNHNTRSYYANLDTKQFGDVPDDVGTGGPKWVHLRDQPVFYRYHDHRTHWMGGKTLPPGVDSSDPDRQLVDDFTIELRYGGTPVKVNGKLEYVGGQTWSQHYGEVLITGLAVLAMLIVFAFDARRRRRIRRTRDGGEDQSPPPGPSGGATVLLPEHEQKEPV